VPWDIFQWKQIEFKSFEDSVEYIKQSLVTNSDGINVEFAKVAVPPPVAPPTPAKPTPDQSFVRTTLTKFPKQVFDDIPSVTNLIFSVATVFDGSAEGLELLHITNLSHGYDKYAWVSALYFKANRSRGIVAYKAHLREVSGSVAYNEIQLEVTQMLAAQAEAEREPVIEEEEYVPGRKLDDKKCFAILDEWYQKYRFIKAKDRTPEMAYELDEAKLKVVKLVNQFYCMIRRNNGAPNSIETMTSASGELRFVFRNMEHVAACSRKFKVPGIGSHIEVWLEHHRQKEADVVIFNPKTTNEIVDDEFNLFRGFEITREMAEECDEDVEPILTQIRYIWCRDNLVEYEYMLNWFATVLQKPWIKTRVTPILSGSQGAGKGVIIEKFGEILGAASFIQYTSSDKVLANFQMDSVKTNIFSLLDEVTFAGDKKQASALKGLISEKRRIWEAKFINAISIESYTNFFMLSNYNNVARVEAGDRRYFCMECDSRYAGPQTDEIAEYFDRILAVPAAAFAKFLYNRDLTGFNVSRIPNTDYGAFQKELNLDPPLMFLDKFLKDDMTFDNDPLSASDWISFPDDTMACIIEKDVFFNMYLAMCTRDKVRYPGPPAEFWKQIKSVIKGTTEPSKKPAGRRSIPITFPVISVCKAAFATHMREPKWFDLA
jgi:hypothetical protein